MYPKIKLPRWAFLPVLLLGVVAAMSQNSHNQKANAFGDHPFLKQLKQKMSRYASQVSAEKVYIQCDKSLYEAGETIWFSVYVRNASTLQAAESDLITVKLYNAQGFYVKELTLFAWKGKAIGQFDLATTEKGGTYKIDAQTNWQKNTQTKYVREITVQKAILPQVDISVDFERASYGAGETAIANATIRDFENKPLPNLAVQAFFTLQYGDGTTKEEGMSLRTDEAGKLQIKYKVSKNLVTEDVRLLLKCDYKNSPQSKSIAVPIVLYPEGIDLQFFAESTDKLVSGVENRVAFKAMGEYGGALDVSGEIVDSLGVVQTTFSSYYKGMGQLKFSPKAGMAYFARVTEPVKSEKLYRLPEATADIYTVWISQQNQHEINISAYSPKADSLFLVAHQNGIIVHSEVIAAKVGLNNLKIDNRDWRIGLTTLTLFDAQQTPRAERLVFCNQHKQLNISLKTNKEKFGIREKVSLQIAVKDADGNPVEGNFSLAVADDKQISFHNDQQAHILASLLLEQQQIKGKIDAPNFYFDPDNKADRKLPNIDRRQALENLLLTQGWRMINWKDVRENDFPAIEYSYKKVRMPAVRGIISDQIYNSVQKQLVILQTDDLSLSRCSTYTDNRGLFFFHNVDWRKPYRLIIPSNQQYVGQDIILSDTIMKEIKLNFYRFSETECKANPIACEERKTLIARAENIEKNRYSSRSYGSDFSVSMNGSRGNLSYCTAPISGSSGRAPKPSPPPATKKPLEPKAVDLTAAKNALAEDRAKYKAPDAIPSRISFLSVHREFYAPRYEAIDDTTEIIRNDFRKTIFWSPSISTDKDGLAQVEFYQSDDISQFRITIEGLSADGIVGRAEHKYFALMPLVLSAQIPTEVIAGDTMLIALTVSNNSDDDLLGAMQLSLPQHLRLLQADSLPALLSVAAKSSRLLRLPIQVLDKPNAGDLMVLFTSSTHKDRLICNINSRRRGFPIQLVYPIDSLQKNIDFDLSNVQAGSGSAEILIMPNMISEILATAKDMARMPSGCFEQVTSSNYPNIFALQILQLNPDKDSAQLQTLNTYLATGYQKLAAYECPDGGFDWYGKSPANEALTAYGLMQFVDMQSVHNIDKDMMERTYKWLLRKRDRKGGWENASSHQYSWGKKRQDLLNTYIVWAMTEANYGQEIANEINQAYRYALKSKDPYVLALVANALLNQKDERSAQVVDILLSKQLPDGFFTGTDCSMTGSTGNALRIETTALVTLALQKTNNHGEKLAQLIQLLQKSRTSSGFGSSQSNALALKALSRYASANATQNSSISIEIDGVVVAKHQVTHSSAPVAVSLPNLSNRPHRISIRQEGNSRPINCVAKINYYTVNPPSQPECVLRFDSQFEQNNVPLSREIRLRTRLENTSKQIQPMAIVQIGIPAGLSLSIEQLQTLQSQAKFDFYEFFDGMLVLHFRQLKAKEQREISLDLKADIAGTYDAPASCAYLYYTNEFKFWQPANRISIK